MHTVGDWLDSFSASSPFPDNSRKARFPVCRKYGIHPDVPSYGLVIPYYNRCIGIGMSARQCKSGKSWYGALGHYPVGCLQLRA